MNYLFGTFYPPLCYVLLPHPACSMPPPPLEPSLLQHLELNNAENNTQTEEPIPKLTLSKEDLLREGYEQTKKAWTEE